MAEDPSRWWSATSSFGTIVTLEGDQESVNRRVAETLRRLVEKCSWRIDSVGGQQVILSTPFNFRSYGETVNIQIDGNSIRIYSRCTFILQWFDWDKNRANVNLVARELEVGETTLLRENEPDARPPHR
jgi:hypothetical protein